VGGVGRWGRLEIIIYSPFTIHHLPSTIPTLSDSEI
jgi:hypothetical protein